MPLPRKRAEEGAMTIEPKDQWIAAMNHMRCALKLLDDSETPAHIGARLDHAIEALQQELGPITGRDGEAGASPLS
jgi:hypothetical protein